MRHEADREAAEHQHDGIWDLDQVGEPHEHGGGGDQADENLDVVHGVPWRHAKVW
jgi:hypothetical protein